MRAVPTILCPMAFVCLIPIHEDVKIADVNAKIDELMAAKTQIMRLRYDHLIEMRRVRSDDQKVGYDAGVLKRSAAR